MRLDQRKSWNREYRLRGKLWRGELKEKEIFEEWLLPGRTLDSGCGNGKGTPPVEDLTGLDFSKFAVELYGGKSRVLGDMVSLPFRDGVFSNVLFIHSLDHLELRERELAFKEASRVLKRDGRVLARVFSTRDFRYGKGHETEKGTFLRGNKIETHYFEKDEFHVGSLFKVTKIYDIDYYINIQKDKFKRSEFIIILAKC